MVNPSITSSSDYYMYASYNGSFNIYYLNVTSFNILQKITIAVVGVCHWTTLAITSCHSIQYNSQYCTCCAAAKSKAQVMNDEFTALDIDLHLTLPKRIAKTTRFTFWLILFIAYICTCFKVGNIYAYPLWTRVLMISICMASTKTILAWNG